MCGGPGLDGLGVQQDPSHHVPGSDTVVSHGPAHLTGLDDGFGV